MILHIHSTCMLCKSDRGRCWNTDLSHPSRPWWHVHSGGGHLPAHVRQPAQPCRQVPMTASEQLWCIHAPRPPPLGGLPQPGHQSAASRCHGLTALSAAAVPLLQCCALLAKAIAYVQTSQLALCSHGGLSQCGVEPGGHCPARSRCRSAALGRRPYDRAIWGSHSGRSPPLGHCSTSRQRPCPGQP